MRRELAALGKTAAQFQDTPYWRRENAPAPVRARADGGIRRSRSGRKLRRAVGIWNDYGLKTRRLRDVEPAERVPDPPPAPEPAPARVPGPRDVPERKFDGDDTGGEGDGVGVDNNLGPSTVGPDPGIVSAAGVGEPGDCDLQKRASESCRSAGRGGLKRGASAMNEEGSRPKLRKLTVLRRMKPRVGAGVSTRVRLGKEVLAEEATGYSETNNCVEIHRGECEALVALDVEDGESITMLSDAILGGKGGGRRESVK